MNLYAMDIQVRIYKAHKFIEEFAQYMTHCRQLKFDEKPDYSKYKKFFKDLFYRCGFEHEFIFDWTIQRYRVDKPSSSSNDGGADDIKSMIKKSLNHMIRS